MPMIFLREGIEHAKEDIDKMFLSMGDYYRDKDYRMLAEIFDVQLFAGTVLDVGCALGDGIVYFKEQNPSPEYYGLDISSIAIKKCIDKNIEAKFFQHDIRSPLDRKFDITICLQTLEHLMNPSLALKNMLNATNRFLIISVPYLNRRKDPGHLFSFNRTTFSYCQTIVHKKTMFCLFNLFRKKVSFNTEAI